MQGEPLRYDGPADDGGGGGGLMVELYKGYRVFVTQRQMIEILSKRKGEAAARCLLMTFYRKHELLGRNLTGRGSGTKSALDPAITKSIIAFCIDRFPECTATKIKAVLRTCITRIEWEAKHGRFNPSLQ
ncbi:PREDICTED: uncharacterized protein LOC106817447 [Priapulus caudatus]|uniref:Uncharacterized protein LOC106817447 n=1 Tax=Priapulus caudatus TaxID=37621 RepID=A0ABM1EZH2_PRICU|nr:PREDICTED: uncharacterized protein LOC106817447 [Priapulus caudatus]